MSKIDELARIAAKAGLNDNVVPESPYRREEDYLGAIAAYFDEDGGGGSGGSGGILVINDQNGTLDKTYQEIEDAFVNKMLCVVFSNPIEGVIACDFVIMAGLNEGKYRVDITGSQGTLTYIADTKDDYPVTAK